MANLARDFGKEMAFEPSPECIGMRQCTRQGEHGTGRATGEDSELAIASSLWVTR